MFSDDHVRLTSQDTDFLGRCKKILKDLAEGFFGRIEDEDYLARKLKQTVGVCFFFLWGSCFHVLPCQGWHFEKS